MANYGSLTKLPALLAICVIIAAYGRPTDLDSDGISNSVSFIVGGINNPSDFGVRNPAHLETQKEGIVVQQCFCPENLNACLCQKEINGGFTNIASRGFLHDTNEFNAENDRGSKDGDRTKKDTSVLSPAEQFILNLPLDNVIRIMYINLPERSRKKFANDEYNRLYQRD
ncbi:uncharacterized protein [Magallana gigas]|uniref:Uncharacterized protein n=1 Tax=Magallana gigas TaxID=29159 RepID=K1PR87_MAGGI|eukprot:XP_011453840.1 PREDICTED: uncharacterized protein LOC105346815 isoform X3 [Crassostrea gigas]